MRPVELRRISTIVAGLLLTGLVAVSCAEKQNPADLLDATMEEINKKDGGYQDYDVINHPDYFGIIYNLEATPENKAKILWLGNNQDLREKFRNEILNNLKKGDILARVVKERKSLILAVLADEIEYHVVLTPEEITREIFKK